MIYRRDLMEKTYEHACAIIRKDGQKDPITKETELTPQTICVDQPCRMLPKSAGTNRQTSVQNDIRYENKLFISPDIEIRQGDNITVSANGVTRLYQAGEPFVFPTHQEVSLQRKDNA